MGDEQRSLESVRREYSGREDGLQLPSSWGRKVSGRCIHSLKKPSLGWVGVEVSRKFSTVYGATFRVIQNQDLGTHSSSLSEHTQSPWHRTVSGWVLNVLNRLILAVPMAAGHGVKNAAAGI